MTGAMLTYLSRVKYVSMAPGSSLVEIIGLMTAMGWSNRLS